jgi:hypothetical protein
MRNHRVSRGISILAIVLFLLLVFDAAVVVWYVHRSHQDTFIVNRLGQVRGAIQQYINLELLEAPNGRIRNGIQENKNELLLIVRERSISSDSIDSLTLFEDLKNDFDDLIHMFDTSVRPLSAESRSEILHRSEELWRMSNSLVLSAQPPYFL